jgi:hypothetical protein
MKTDTANNKRTFKTIKWTVLMVVLTGLGLFIYLIVSPTGFYDIREFLNQNSITIRTDNKLDKTKVDVFWTPEMGRTLKVVDNGEELDIIYKEYGPNLFTVIYNHDTVGTFSYFKTNNWHGHRHVIKLTLTDKGDIKCNVGVSGPDAD